MKIIENILAILLILLFALTLSLLSNAVEALFPEETTIIIVSIIGIIEALIAATFWFSAKNKEIHAWRTIWLAGAILCIAYGWFKLPKIYEEQILIKAVDTSRQLEGVKNAYPTPKTKSEKDWVSKHELHAKIADLRWEYYKKINDETNWLSMHSIITFSMGLLCLLCVFFARPIIDRIENNT